MTNRTHRHVALLRGINVGGKHRLPMADLRRLFERAGAANVRTVIQSGNVLFDATSAGAARVADEVANGIEAGFGFRVPLVVRPAAALGRIVAANPFADADPDTLHVAFLADRPKPSLVRSLDPDRSPPDAFVVRGGEIYLHLPNGAARSRLTTAWFDARLETTATVRNWRTVLRLIELAEA